MVFLRSSGVIQHRKCSCKGVRCRGTCSQKFQLVSGVHGIWNSSQQKYLGNKIKSQNLDLDGRYGGGWDDEALGEGTFTW